MLFSMGDLVACTYSHCRWEGPCHHSYGTAAENKPEASYINRVTILRLED